MTPTVNVTFARAHTAWLAGWLVIFGDCASSGACASASTIRKNTETLIAEQLRVIVATVDRAPWAVKSKANAGRHKRLVGRARGVPQCLNSRKKGPRPRHNLCHNPADVLPKTGLLTSTFLFH